MQVNCLHVFAVFAGAIVGVASAGEPADSVYQIVDLGAIAPESIGPAGDVVGQGGSYPNMWLPEARYGLGAGTNNLGTLYGGGGMARDVNADGLVVGRTAGPDVEQRAFLWSPGSGMTDIGTLGGPGAEAFAINAQGWIVGESNAPGQSAFVLHHAFLHDGTQMFDLGTFGGEISEAYDLNDLGQVVGLAWYDDGTPDPLDSRSRCALWLPQAAFGLPMGINDLDALSGDPNRRSRGIAINDQGQVAAVRSVQLASGQVGSGGSVWLPAPAYGLPAGWTDTGAPGAGEYAYFDPYDMNDDGAVVGEASTAIGFLTTPRFAYMWSGGRFARLESRIPLFNRIQWDLERATGINDDGSIVGVGTRLGQERAFRLVPVDAVASCPTDFDGDGNTGFSDLTTLINAWGAIGLPDLDGNGTIGFSDLSELLAAWGACPQDTSTGACCLTEFECVVTTQANCGSVSGTWQGAGTTCGDCPSAPMLPGDTVDTAIVIPSLPYADEGDTSAGYNNAYYFGCFEFSTSIAPEVVYAFTPSVNTFIDISLCRDTEFDTVLYVYRDVAGAVTECNDDACSTPSLPIARASELLSFQAAGGSTYYIVIDGGGDGDGESGRYTIDVTVSGF